MVIDSDGRRLRGDINNFAARTGTDHQLCSCLRAEKRPGKIHRDLLLPLGKIGFNHGLQHHVARAVHQDIDAAIM